jgi:hypothetical protein
VEQYPEEKFGGHGELGTTSASVINRLFLLFLSPRNPFPIFHSIVAGFACLVLISTTTVKISVSFRKPTQLRQIQAAVIVFQLSATKVFDGQISPLSDSPGN